MKIFRILFGIEVHDNQKLTIMKTNNKLIKALIFLSFISSTLFSQDKLFWADVQQGNIKVMDIDAQNDPVTILQESFIDYHASDFVNEKIYWSDKGKSLIAMSNIDGSNKETIIDNLLDPKGITLNNGYIYFIDKDRILRADINGTNQQVIIDGLSEPTDLVYWNDSLFWTDVTDDQIEVIRVDGTGRTTILTGVLNPIDIEIDKENSELYWVQRTGVIPSSGIFKSDIDGTNKETILEKFVNGIRIDEELEYLYWSESIFNTINRLNLSDQSNIRLINEYLPFPRSITIDKLNNKIYFSDYRNGGVLYKANLSDGSIVTEVIDTEVYRPDRIEVDALNEKIYWINSRSSSFNDNRSDIMRSDLNGQNIERLISYPDVRRPEGLALNLTNNYLYWSDLSLGTISRASLDGSNIETLVSGLDNPTGLTINFESNKLYWGDWGTKKIQSSELDGQNIEDIVSDDITPIEVAIYYKDSKIYWTDLSNGTINRCNYDGTNIENIITTENPTFNHPNSIHIDQKNDKLYYSIGFSGEKIQRSDMDGANIEDIVTDDISSPRDLFLVNSIISSTSYLTNDFEVVTFPNPISDFYTVKSDQYLISELLICNSSGQRLYKKDNINTLSHTINMIDFPGGIYFVSVFMGNKVKTFKIIK